MCNRPPCPRCRKTKCSQCTRKHTHEYQERRRDVFQIHVEIGGGGGALVQTQQGATFCFLFASRSFELIRCTSEPSSALSLISLEYMLGPCGNLTSVCKMFVATSRTPFFFKIIGVLLVATKKSNQLQITFECTPRLFFHVAWLFMKNNVQITQTFGHVE